MHQFFYLPVKMTTSVSMGKFSSIAAWLKLVLVQLTKYFCLPLYSAFPQMHRDSKSLGQGSLAQCVTTRKYKSQLCDNFGLILSFTSNVVHLSCRNRRNLTYLINNRSTNKHTYNKDCYLLRIDLKKSSPTPPLSNLGFPYSADVERWNLRII